MEGPSYTRVPTSHRLKEEKRDQRESIEDEGDEQQQATAAILRNQEIVNRNLNGSV